MFGIGPIELIVVVGLFLVGVVIVGILVAAAIKILRK